MKRLRAYIEPIKGAIKDSFVILLLFMALCFVDVSLAVFIGSISFAVLLIRRIILYYNPGFIKGHHIYDQEKELTVAKEVDVFDLGGVPSLEYLFNYTEVIRSMLIPPRIFIIRFCGIVLLKEPELETLRKVLWQLKSRKITVLLSDIEENMMLNQSGWHSIENEVGLYHIFFNIKDALTFASGELTEA